MEMKLIEAQPGWKLVIPEIEPDGQERKEEIIAWFVVATENDAKTPGLKVLPVTVYGIWDDTLTTLLKPNGERLTVGRKANA